MRRSRKRRRSSSGSSSTRRRSSSSRRRSRSSRRRRRNCNHSQRELLKLRSIEVIGAPRGHNECIRARSDGQWCRPFDSAGRATAGCERCSSTIGTRYRQENRERAVGYIALLHQKHTGHSPHYCNIQIQSYIFCNSIYFILCTIYYIQYCTILYYDTIRQSPQYILYTICDIAYTTSYKERKSRLREVASSCCSSAVARSCCLLRIDGMRQRDA